MAKALYRLLKAEPGSGLLGAHELKGGKVVTHSQPQTFDPVEEGIADFVELVEAPAPAKTEKAAAPAKTEKAADKPA